MTWRYPKHTPQHRDGWTLTGLTLVTFGLYYVYWLYRLHAETPARMGTDPRTSAVALPFVVAGVSLVPVVASGVVGGGEVNLALFTAGMAVNFVSHLLFLWLTWKLAGRLAGVAEACGLDSTILVAGRRDVALGVLAIAFENIGLKSISLLSLDVPAWLGTLDGVLLVIGVFGMWSWSRQCLLVANSFAANEDRAYAVLGLQE